MLPRILKSTDGLRHWVGHSTLFLFLFLFVISRQAICDAATRGKSPRRRRNSLEKGILIHQAYGWFGWLADP